MRARPREINIFNMSLLDILCGALGAFCFMMLVALPYYVAGPADQAQSQQRTEDLLKDVEQLRQRMSDPAQAEDLRKLIDELEAQIKQLQGRVNQLAYENDQLKDTNTRLTSDNQNLQQQVAHLKQENAQLVADKSQLQDANDQLMQEKIELNEQLAAKKPFAVMAASGSQAVDLYLERTRYIVLGNQFESFDPNAKGHLSPISEDVIGWALQNGVSVWVNANSKPGDAYRVYVKFLTAFYESIPSGDTTVRVNFFGPFEDKNAQAAVALNRARPFMLVGVVNIGTDGKLNFKESTAAERDDDWRNRMKSDPPPAPTPETRARSTPAASATPNAEDRDKQVREYIRRRGGVVPSPTVAQPSATP